MVKSQGQYQILINCQNICNLFNLKHIISQDNTIKNQLHHNWENEAPKPSRLKLEKL